MSSSFWEIVGFELRFRSRQVPPYIFFAILFVLAVAIMSTDVGFLSTRDGHSYVNSPSSLALIGTLLLALGSMMVSAVGGTAIYRDFETNTHELFFTTHLTKRDYYFGRFLGSFLVLLVISSAIPLGFLCGAAAPWAHKDILGPFRPDAYFALFFEFLLPDLFLLGALFFVWGTLTRSLLAIYTQGIALLILWLCSVALLSGLENRDLSALLEPFGIGAASEVMRYWTLVEQNGRLIPFVGLLLQNRLLWSGVALVVLIGGYFLFDLAHSPLTWRQRPKPAVPKPLPPASTVIDDKSVPPGGWRYHLAVYQRLTRFYTSEIFRGVPFLLITLGGIFLLVISASETDKIYDTAVYPVTRIILNSIIDTFGIFHVALITFYTGELIWRERVLRADQTTDALPIATPEVLLSKVTAVLLMTLGLNVILILTGIVIQIAKGYYHFELSLYVFRLLVISPLGLFSVILLAFFLHTVINQKFLAHTALILVFIVSSALSDFGWERHLYRYDSGPEIVYSDMNGFGPFLAPAFSWQAYWVSVGTLLLMVALHLWVRGTDGSLRARWRNGCFGIGAQLTTVLAFASFLGVGVFLLYNTDILHKYLSSKDENRILADYERHYKAKWQNKPMPRITQVTVDIALYPEKRQYRMRGFYLLKNRTKQTIQQIVLDYDADLTVHQLAFAQGAKVDREDRPVGFRVVTLDHPLPPEAETRLDFDLAYEKRGFPNDNPTTDIAGNGTFLLMPQLRIGYQENGELLDNKERKKQGLPSRPMMAPVTDMAARNNTYIGNDADWIDFDATVRTTADQIGIAPGYLLKEWTEKGQHCFHYKMDAPIRNFYAILSARYSVKKDDWTGSDGKKVALAIYYHPTHAYNLNRMMKGMKTALTYCSENFAPYQFHQLRIIEFPDYKSLAQSFPNTIPYSEGVGFIARVRDEKEDIDYPLYVTAHETAHQWWAHQVIGGDVAGSEVLSESLAEYSALMVLQKNYGRDYTHRFLRYDLDQYLTGRSGDSGYENPLVSAQHQQYIHYNKGALVFYALAERIGEKRLNAILSRFLHDKRFQSPPYTTATELVSYLKEGATPSERRFISDLFEKITLYDCRATSATAKKEKNGKWSVTIEASVTKYYANADGEETAAPLDDRFTFGVFAEPKKDTRDKHALGKPLLVSEAYFTSTKGIYKRTFHCEVNEKPYQAGIDPYNTLIDRLPDNNVDTVDVK